VPFVDLIRRRFRVEVMHQGALVLLPWYANGSLKKREWRRVHRHLSRCASCREELAHLEDVQYAMTHLPTPLVGEAGFAHLMNSIDAMGQRSSERSGAIRGPSQRARDARARTNSAAWLNSFRTLATRRSGRRNRVSRRRVPEAG
jgi:hypothetical protein